MKTLLIFILFFVLMTGIELFSQDHPFMTCGLCENIPDTSTAIDVNSVFYINLYDRDSLILNSYNEGRICDSLIANLEVNNQIQESFALCLEYFLLFDSENKLQGVLISNKEEDVQGMKKISELLKDNIFTALKHFEFKRPDNIPSVPGFYKFGLYIER